MVLLLAVGCGNGDEDLGDGGPGDDTDAGVPADGSDGTSPPELPECLQGEDPPGCAEAPRFVDWECPEGWASVPAYELTEEEKARGEPEPHNICKPPDSSGSCPHGADWPTEDALRPIASGFEGKITYAKAGAPAGGDGSRGAPYGNIMDAHVASRDGDIIALAAGEYREAVVLTDRIALVGACVAGTSVVAPDTDEFFGTVEMTHDGGALLARVRVTGPRRGVWVFDNAAPIELRSVVVEQALRAGIVFSHTSAGGVLTDVVVRDTQSLSDGTDGGGLYAQDGAVVTVERGVFERNRDLALVAWTNPGAQPPHLQLTDVVVRDTLSLRDGTGGRGLSVLDGAVVTVERGVFERNREMGVIAGTSSPDTQPPELTLTDVVVRDTQSRSDGTGGDGLFVQEGPVVMVQRAVFERNREAGIYAATFTTGAPATQLRLTDVVVRDTQGRSEGKLGLGLGAAGGAVVTVDQGVFERSRGAGIFASSAADITLTDVIVRDTLSMDDGTAGRGLNVQDGAVTTVDGGVFERNRDVAVFASTASNVTLTDVVVRHTRESACAGIPAGEEFSCAGFGAGMGLVSVLSSDVRITRFLVAQSAFVGIMVARDGVVRATTGEITRNKIGVNIQVEDYDYNTFADDVLIYDNDTDVDTTDIPIPDPTEALSSRRP